MTSRVPIWVDELAYWLRLRGLSYKQIAEELNRREIPPPSDDSLGWHDSAARRAVLRTEDRWA